jgi:hypothetical protein
MDFDDKYREIEVELRNLLRITFRDDRWLNVEMKNIIAVNLDKQYLPPGHQISFRTLDEMHAVRVILPNYPRASDPHAFASVQPQQLEQWLPEFPVCIQYIGCWVFPTYTEQNGSLLLYSDDIFQCWSLC